MDHARWKQTKSTLERLEIHDQLLPEESRFRNVREVRTEALSDLELLVPLWERSESALPEQLNRLIDGTLSGLASLAQERYKEANELLTNVPQSDSRFKERWMAVEAASSERLRTLVKERAAVHALLHAAASSDTLGISSGESSRRLQEMQDTIRDGKALLESLNSKDIQLTEKIGQVERKAAADTYEKRSITHKWLEWAYFGAFVIACGGLALFARAAFLRPQPDQSRSIDMLVYVAHGLLLIVPPAVLVQITLRRWSLERNLRLLYEHRVAAVDQFERIIKSIPETLAEPRAQMRVDFARMVLADPITGYLDASTSQLNYGPAAKLAEKSTGP